MVDIGYEGQFRPMIADPGTLLDLQKLAGQPPFVGKKWVMVNLQTGEVKWYMSSRRRGGGGRYPMIFGGGYRRRYRY